MPKPVNVWDLINTIHADLHSDNYEISVGVRWPEKGKILEYIDIFHRETQERVVRVYFDRIGTDQLALSDTITGIVRNWEGAALRG